jgi:hypothetical protein
MGEMMSELDGQDDPDAAWSDLLDGLRWREDMPVMSPTYQEMWWLKPHYDEHGERDGITDCCPGSDPCARHAA